MSFKCLAIGHKWEYHDRGMAWGYYYGDKTCRRCGKYEWYSDRWFKDVWLENDAEFWSAVSKLATPKP